MKIDEIEMPNQEETKNLKSLYPAVFLNFAGVLPDESIAFAIKKYDSLSKEDLYCALIGLAVEVSMIEAATSVLRDAIDPAKSAGDVAKA